ncbi:MAG: tetratricopeptide repeat protein [Planctomycetaceae bacterium]|nr:tetratricopeptide repeat protein [Planctomycetaceae bacterium]
MKNVSTILLVFLLLGQCGCSTYQTQHGNTSGVQLFADGKYAEALARFQTALETNPNDADSYYNIAAVHHYLGRVNRDANQYVQAGQNYQLCLTKNPNHAAAYRGYAVWFMEQDRKAEAIELLKNWSDQNPSVPDPKIELARLYQELGQNREAIDYLAAAIALDSKNARAHRALGYLREQSSDWNQAILNYKYSLESDPNQPDLVERITILEKQAGLSR